MSNQVIVAVQFGDDGRPLNFEIGTYSGHGTSPVDGGNRFESASKIAQEVLDGAKYNTLVRTGSGAVLGGFLMVTQDASGAPVFGIDSASSETRTLKDLRRLR
ncbi:hypothetical protein [Pseudomonas sp. ESBL1]|uniref:hypothetical protein n=1 Tax=Pseudomonas sp. ESBL1 TaxID=3077324 RepID=UPI002FCB3572